MKPGCIRLIVGLIIFGLGAASCGRNESNGNSNLFFASNHAPSLWGVTLNPDSVLQYEGNGTIPVSFSFEFTDAGGDLSSLTITVYDGNGVELDSATDPFEEVSGIKNGYVEGGFSADTNVAGNYTIKMYVTDSRGKVSNAVQATFTVVPVALLVSIEVTPANPTIDAMTTQQFTARGTYDDNTTLDITELATWTTSDENVASINVMGYPWRAYGKNRGSTTITATKDGISGSTVLNVLSDFGPHTQYPGMPNHLLGNTAIGDLNGDGRNDVAVMVRNSDTVLLYYQKTDHTLDIAQNFTTGLDLKRIAIGDVNNDGLADLIAAGVIYDSDDPGNGGGKIYVYKQDTATHALGAPQKYPVSSFIASWLAVTDMNNDGLPDVVVSGLDLDRNALISFLIQGPAGTLAAEVTYTSVPIYDGGEMHVADMNHDGLNDIVIQSGAKQVAVIKQVSPGAFSNTPDYYYVSTNYWPDVSSFALGDLNGDGRRDIATVDIVSYGDLNILTQDNTGLFTDPALKLPYGADEIKIVDMDGDNLNDIVMLVGGYLVKILYQSEDHTFSRVRTYTVYGGSGGMSMGDVTGDGLTDIVTSCTDGLISVLPRLP